MSKISVLTPTRARPQKMEQFLLSIKETISEESNVELIFFIDDDDTISLKKLDELIKKYKYVSGVSGPPGGVLSNLFNLLIPYCSEETEIFLPQGDDSIFRTKSWDIQVINFFNSTFSDKIVWYCVDDGHHGKNFATSGFLHKNWLSALEYLVPPYFTADWADTWLWEMTKELGRNIFSGILVEHMHPDFGKGVLDQTYLLRSERLKSSTPLYHSGEMIEKRKLDTLKLLRYIEDVQRETERNFNFKTGVD